jgi:hypothetical protein
MTEKADSGRGDDLPSFMIFVVLSRKSVSFGDILWNTTFWIEDLPLLRRYIMDGKHTLLVGDIRESTVGGNLPKT